MKLHVFIFYIVNVFAVYATDVTIIDWTKGSNDLTRTFMKYNSLRGIHIVFSLNEFGVIETHNAQCEKIPGKMAITDSPFEFHPWEVIGVYFFTSVSSIICSERRKAEIIVYKDMNDVHWNMETDTQLTTIVMTVGDVVRINYSDDIKGVVQVKDSLCTPLLDSVISTTKPFYHLGLQIGTYYFTSRNSKDCSQVKKIRIVVKSALEKVLDWTQDMNSTLTTRYIKKGHTLPIVFSGKIAKMTDSSCSKISKENIIDSPFYFHGEKPGNYYYIDTTSDKKCSERKRARIVVYKDEISWTHVDKQFTEMSVYTGHTVAFHFDVKNIVGIRKVADRQCGAISNSQRITKSPYYFEATEVDDGAHYFISENSENCSEVNMALIATVSEKSSATMLSTNAFILIALISFTFSL